MNLNIIYLLIAIVAAYFIYKYVRKMSKATEVSQELKSFDILEIQMPKLDESKIDIQASALAAENMFASIHGLLREDYHLQEHFSFEICSSSDGIRFYIVSPKDIIKFIESQVYAQYPAARIRLVDDYTKTVAPGLFKEVTSVSLNKDNFFPIKTFRDIEFDPLSGITSALAEVHNNDQVWFQLLIKPIPDNWQEAGNDYIKMVRTGVAKEKPDSIISILFGTFIREFILILLNMVIGFFVASKPEDKSKAVSNIKSTVPPRLSAAQEVEVRAIEDKISKMAFEVQFNLVSYSENPSRVKANIRSLMASLNQLTFSNLNSFKTITFTDSETAVSKYIRRMLDKNRIILNISELATIFHFPASYVETPNISWIYSKRCEPPSDLPTTNCNYIGETTYRNQTVRFGLANNDDRLRHLYVIGKSGTGKSTLFETMISQDIQNGFGVGVLDPHGETIDKVLSRIPDNRVEDVIYFDPSDVDMPPALNLLEMRDNSQKNLMASGLVSAIRHHFDYSWGPRLEYLLNYCILTLLEVPSTTMLGITRLLEDDNYRKYILHFVKDPIVQKFWEKEFKEMKGNQKLVTEAIAPIQNKVNRFLASTTMRNILGQKKSTIDIWDAMNTGKILLMNLSKGKIGEDNANLLGALLVSRIQFMALQRANIPYEKRRHFYLYVDEFQNFATGSFESILSESRKYGLGLHLTHQYLSQLPEELSRAVLGNVGTIISFSIGAQDAKAFSYEFAPYFDENDLISLERFHIYIKLMKNGMTSIPFSARILVPWDPKTCIVPMTNNRERVLELSRAKYGVDRSYIESKINKWVDTPFDKGMAIAQEIRDKQVQQAPEAAAGVVNTAIN